MYKIEQQKIMLAKKIKMKIEATEQKEKVFSFFIDFKIPSINIYWKKGKNGIIYISKEGKEFKKAIQHISIAKLNRRKREGLKIDKYNDCFAVEIIQFHKKKGRGDVDNKLKILLDSLEGVVFSNDNQVLEVVAKKIRNSDLEGSLINVYRYLIL